MKTKYFESDDFIINEQQSDRFWIHSKERGYGYWVYNSEIEEVFKEKDKKKINHNCEDS